MCGIVARVGPGARGWDPTPAQDAIGHRGPDGRGVFRRGDADDAAACVLAHVRLKVIDLSDAAAQPMTSADGRYTLVFNGEIYNHVELRAELGADAGAAGFRTRSDTEVLLRAWARWGPGCLDRLLGMFAFVLWDERERRLWAVRDRFGVKPLFVHEAADGTLTLASEIKALFSAGIDRRVDEATWATYLVHGLHDHGRETFWDGITSLGPGELLVRDGLAGARARRQRWYDLGARVAAAGLDGRPDDTVVDDFAALVQDSVRLRFRADVPVGLCLSGGLDSSLLLALVRAEKGADVDLHTFTFVTGDDRYDELPWVQAMLAGTRLRSHVVTLDAAGAPALTAEVAACQDEPFGGFPTVAMALVHRAARDAGVVVLLDGNGMDEAFGGYEYYRRADGGEVSAAPVQGARSPTTRADVLRPSFAALARAPQPPQAFAEPMRNLQLRDLTYAKIPRALRFADRVSMQASRELREPFLDHRLVELGLRQPPARHLADPRGKSVPRRLAARLIPNTVAEAPKRAVQTPQREWLSGPLWPWLDARIADTLRGPAAAWFDPAALRRAAVELRGQVPDNAFAPWQWASVGLFVGANGQGS